MNDLAVAPVDVSVREGGKMTSGTRVSVVVGFLNAERFIQEAIDSVFAQTSTDWEPLLVDDGSTDASTEIAKRCAGPRRTVAPYTH